MSTVYADIGSDGGPSDDGILSDWVKKLVISREDFTVGTWLIELDDADKRCWGKFTPNEGVEFQIDTIRLMTGYVDDSLAEGLPRELPQEICRVVGRDHSRELYDRTYTGKHSDELTRMDYLMSTIITAVAPNNILYTVASPGIAPFKPIVFDRTRLTDGFKDLCTYGVVADNYVYYVDDDGIAGPRDNFQLVSLATPPAYVPAVTLYSLPGSALNNILDIRPVGEARGRGIYNYIHVRGPLIDDHYSEGDAANWAGIAGNVLTDDALIFLSGSASIRMTRVGVGVYGMDLTFPRHSYTALDFSSISRATAYYQVHHDVALSFRLRPRLEDGAGNIIEYYSFPKATGDRDSTDEIPQSPAWPAAPIWASIPFPIGVDLPIRAVLTNGSWWYIAPAVAFDWSDVVGIGFTSVGNFAAGYCGLDGLSLPINAISIAQDGASQGSYGVRELPVTRFDLTSQNQLDRASEDLLAKYKDSLETLHAVIEGNTIIDYTGHTVQVIAQRTDATPYIDNVAYRVQALRHEFGDHLISQWQRNYITGLTLVKQTI